jgi:hypothetical protein
MLLVGVVARIVKIMRIASIALSLVVITAALLIPMLGGRVNPKQKPQIDSRALVSAILSISGERAETFTNTAEILTLLRSGRPVQPHRCQMAGQITFPYESGNQWSVCILPGHSATNYEFSCFNRYYEVPRVAFMTTLAAAGIDTSFISIK